MKIYVYLPLYLIIGALFASCSGGELEKREEYYDNGSLSKVYFVDEQGFKQGQYIEYFENGKLMLVCNYLSDTLNGDYVVFTETGNLGYKYEMENGVNHGSYVGFNNEGEVVVVADFYKGQQMKVVTYYGNGVMRRISSHNSFKGLSNVDVYFDEQGHIIDSISRYCTINYFDTDSISVSLSRDLLKAGRVDSLMVDVLPSFHSENKLRRIKKLNTGSISFALQPSDYVDDTLRLKLNWYKPPKKSSNPNIYYPPTKNEMLVELVKGQAPPIYNAHPIR